MDACTWCGADVEPWDGFRAYEPAGGRRAVFCRLEHVVPWAIRGAHWEPLPLEAEGVQDGLERVRVVRRGAARGPRRARALARRAPDSGRILRRRPPARVGEGRRALPDLSCPFGHGLGPAAAGTRRGEMIHHRHYTVAEANAKLALVGTVVRRIQEARRTPHRRRLRQRVRHARRAQRRRLAGPRARGRGARGRARFRPPGGARHRRPRPRARADRLPVADRRRGGLPVLAARRAEVGHWHAPESGFGGRRPL